MSNRWLRFVIALLAFAAAGAAGYKIFEDEQHLVTEEGKVRAGNAAAETALTTLAEIEAALHAYVAPGQEKLSWTVRASKLFGTFRSSLLTLDEIASASGAPLTEALDLADRLSAAEQRARTHLTDGQALLAGEVIFSESRHVVDALKAELTRTRTELGQRADLGRSAARREQAMLALTAAVVMGFAVLLLVLPRRANEAPTVGAATGSAKVTGAPEHEEYARLLPSDPRPPATPSHARPAGASALPPARPASGVRMGSTGSVQRPTPSPTAPRTGAATPVRSSSTAPGTSTRTALGAPVAPVDRTEPIAPVASASARSGSGELRRDLAEAASGREGGPVIDLVEAAAVCSAFASATDRTQIDAVLSRASRVMNASGIIVWMASADGGLLFPTGSAGYDERLMARLGALPRDAANLTASAFRDATARTSPKGVSAAAALAIPLLTAQGAAGVLSAELKDVASIEREQLAVATIFAAQLSLLMTGKGTAESAAPAPHAQAL